MFQIFLRIQAVLVRCECYFSHSEWKINASKSDYAKQRIDEIGRRTQIRGQGSLFHKLERKEHIIFFKKNQFLYIGFILYSNH